MAGVVPGAEYGSTSHGVLLFPVMSEGNLAHAWALALHLGSRSSPVNQFLLFTARIQLSLKGALIPVSKYFHRQVFRLLKALGSF